MNDAHTKATSTADDAWVGRTQDLVAFDGLPLTFPDNLNQNRITEHLQRILNHVGEACDQPDALTHYQSWRSRFHAAAQANSALLGLLDDRVEPLDNEALLALEAKLIAQRQAGLVAQAQLQLCEGRLNARDVQRLHYALGLAHEPEDAVLHLDVGVGAADTPTVFHGAMIVTTEQALKSPAIDDPALLFVPGRDGGLQKFASLRDLKRQLVFTLTTGSETTLWQHVNATQRETAMAAPINLVTRVITRQPILHGVKTQLRAFETAYDKPPALQNLAMALDETREHAIQMIAEQQRTSELVAQFPGWLLRAKLEVRQEYVQKLVEFHAAAVRLELHLDTQLPSFQAFTAQRLNARIKQDLALDIDTDQLMIDLPKSVHKDVDIDPQYGTPLHHKPWKASEARVKSSLSELARQNFDAGDEETRASMTLMMKVSYPPSPMLSGLQGIDGDYLLKMIPQLDIAGQYRTLLRSVFRLRAPASTPDTLQMLKAYELQIELDGFCARQRGHLSEAGYALLVQAARARSTAELSQAGVHVSRLIFKPGQAVSGERSSRTLQGLSCIEHPASGRVLVYLPQVPDGECVIEASSVQDARERLISSLLRLPTRIPWLASCVENASEQTAAISYINEALRRGFEGFIAIVPALDLLISEQQLHVREDLYYEQSRQAARSNHDLKQQQRQRSNRLYLMFFRGVISFVPGLGVLFSLQDGWSDGHASAKALREGNLDEGLLLAGSTLLCAVDILLSVIPAGSTVGALALLARRSTRLRQAAGLTHTLPSMTRRSYAIKRFEGYEADISLLDAVPQAGQNSGTWLKDGKLFIYRNSKAYQVYRRPGEQTLRLKKTPTQGYEAPVRQEAGEWIYHSDVGLRGGGRSMVAEVLLVEGHGNSAFQRKQARELLDQYDFPADQQRCMELEFAEHYRKTKTIPDWAEQHRRAPAPQPPTLSGKRKEPDTPHVEPVAGPSRPAASADAWQGWDKHLDDLTVLDQISVNPPVYRLDFTHDYDVIRAGQKFYEILPPGGQRRTNTAFIRNPDPHASCRNFAEFNEVIRRNPYDQPLMAKYDPTTTQWKVEGPLFKLKIETYIAQARPGFTDTSNLILAQKLFEMADTSTSAMTATRMINIKATLNAWRAGELAPLAQLNDPLLMLNKAHPQTEAGVRFRWKISYESSLQTFERLDFATDNPVTTEWLIRAVSESGGNVRGLRGLMADVLGRNGYEILHNQLQSGHRDFIAFRRTGQDELYLLYLRRAQNSAIETVPSGMFQNPAHGDGLLAPLIQSYAGQPIATLLEQARDQGKVIRLMGGTNIKSQSSSGMQVFVIRLPDEILLNSR